MFSVGRILEGAFGVIREHFVAVLIWAGLYLAASIAILMTTAPLMRSAMGDPGALMAAMVPIYLLNLLLGLVGLVIYTAAMRAVLRPQAGGLAYLRLGMDELRIFGLTLIFVIAGVAAGFGFSLLLGVLGMGAMAASQSALGSMIFGFVLVLALVSIVVFLMIRFALAFPLTLHRRRIVIGEAWRISRGRFWKLFGAALVITLIGMAMSIAVASFAMGSYFADLMAASGNPEAAAAVAEQQMESVGMLSPGMILQSVASALVGAIWIALSAGSTATAAKLLVEDEFDDAEEVFG
ncbi:hypothetical protein [Sphingomonas sp.]|uniref:hypothetical protein n=1 Tax=Sphingomonas sp. TaxID=28214 RepID=UPI001EB7A8FC|nr:hypothetical protein [Sphingomonas sp.]MBX3595799.1 hypothetical protein [Sphingomonas sp.]